MRILAVALWSALGAACLGLVCGLIYAIGGFFYDLFTTGLNWGTLLAFGAIVGMPLVFATVGFVLGALVALVIAAVRARAPEKE